MIVTRSQLETKIKATRVLRALETIESEWEKEIDERVAALYGL